MNETEEIFKVGETIININFVEEMIRNKKDFFLDWSNVFTSPIWSHGANYFNQSFY